MPKNIVIAEGGQGRTLTGVKKLTTKLQGGGTCRWVPEDEAGDFVKLKTKNITKNGEYSAQLDDCTGYSSVKVNIRQNVKAKRIIANGTYNAVDDKADGYSQVTVDVPGGKNLGTKKITSNGEYRAKADGLDGYASVTVNVEGGGGGETSGFPIGEAYSLLEGGAVFAEIIIGQISKIN